PTHYAVALQYRHGETPAPVITARGAGELALRMREEARRRRVPVVENPPLARALFKVRGAELFVPEENFQDVARILRWVYSRRRRPAWRRSHTLLPSGSRTVDCYVNGYTYGTDGYPHYEVPHPRAGEQRSILIYCCP